MTPCYKTASAHLERRNSSSSPRVTSRGKLYMTFNFRFAKIPGSPSRKLKEKKRSSTPKYIGPAPTPVRRGKKFFSIYLGTVERPLVITGLDLIASRKGCTFLFLPSFFQIDSSTLNICDVSCGCCANHQWLFSVFSV